MQNLAFIYKTIFAYNDYADLSNFNDFVELYSSKNPNNKGVFDISILSAYQNDPAFAEKQLLKLILKLNNIPIEPEYLNLYVYNMNVEGISNEKDNGIFVDELFTYTILSFFLTVSSLANDNGNINFERCFKNFIVTLDLQGRRKIIVTHNKLDFQEMMCMPINVLNIACDTYWCVLSFIIGHELYHLTHKNIVPSLEDEKNADRFGYNILINMIEYQKAKRIPEEFQVFSENQYLSPIMFLEYLRLSDKFQTLCDANAHKKPSQFSPDLRKRLILELYYDDIPEEFDTDEGNDLLNIFLDIIDILEEQLIIKINSGKLDLNY